MHSLSHPPQLTVAGALPPLLLRCTSACGRPDRIAQGSGLKDAKLMKILDQLATDTGGIAFRLNNPEKIGEVFSEVSRLLAGLRQRADADHAGETLAPRAPHIKSRQREEKHQAVKRV
jgi:hypothetical protein